MLGASIKPGTLQIRLASEYAALPLTDDRPAAQDPSSRPTPNAPPPPTRSDVGIDIVGDDDDLDTGEDDDGGEDDFYADAFEVLS